MATALVDPAPKTDLPPPLTSQTFNSVSFKCACETSVSARSELSLMGGWSRSAVLQLYRALLRAGQHLQYTDRDYYRRTVTREFRRCQTLSAPAEREDALKRGQFFLNSGLGGLV
ncbi:hypothetical protein G5714_003113 [Onychostoma macrolepis]|uniref:Complex 1 LYR protein domain-containing protein n=2 Tax=Onychostoma macrolepis TaxID=369639 RepID=A0A7J6D9M9_9TELE|nr:hypothetical protein G5714_003113 [Onychostoma macrolepis]